MTLTAKVVNDGLDFILFYFGFHFHYFRLRQRV